MIFFPKKFSSDSFIVTAIKNLDNDLINPMEKIYEHASDSQCIDLIAQIAENISSG